MKPYASVVRPKLMSLPIEASLMIQDITDARPSSTFSPPVSGYFSTADSRLNVFSGRPTHNSRDLKFHTVSSVKDGSSRSDYLESFPSILLPVTTPSISGRVCLSQNFKNRTRMKNSLFPIDANKTQSYLDPHLGATASFVQRLSEISSLEVETVRQEKMKRLRKINRQDS
ncbi:putative uncharacterized protein C8orf89 homolog isoform X3 [Danio rerio]|uniref:Uncharacterized protein n=1 Tax=Danio rerio TaxID=7955 RepID=A0AC58IRG9_DANRE